MRLGALLPNDAIPVSEKRQILFFLSRAPSTATSPMAADWARSLELPVEPTWLFDGSVAPVASQLMARSDEAVESILTNLSVDNIPTPHAKGMAFQVLVERLRRDPLPPREWMLRALNVSRRYPTEISGQLQHEINGS